MTSAEVFPNVHSCFLGFMHNKCLSTVSPSLSGHPPPFEIIASSAQILTTWPSLQCLIKNSEIALLQPVLFLAVLNNIQS